MLYDTSIGDDTMPQNKNISRKHLSIFDIFNEYPTLQSQIDFFFHFKWPNGYICPKCGSRNYTFLSNRGEFECTHCHHQDFVTAGTILQDTKLPLQKWIFMLYLVCDSKTGISAAELGRKVGIGYTSARLNPRKIRFAMTLRNHLYLMEGLVEHDEIYIGAPSKNGKRGLGTDKQLVFMDLQIENNIYPKYVGFQLGEKQTTEATLEALRKNVKEGSILDTDGNKAYPGLEPVYQVKAQAND